MLRMESPPRSKKSSVTPMFSTPSRSAQIAASVASVSVRGATKPWACQIGAGSAFRSSFPLGFNGNASSVWNTEGTM